MTGTDVLALFAQALPAPETLQAWSSPALTVSQLLLWDRSIRINRKVDEIRRGLRLRSTVKGKHGEKETDD